MSKPKPLTSRQVAVVRAIEAYLRLHGQYPTVRELMAELGLSSTNGITDHLVALEKKGWVRRSLQSRGLRLLQALEPVWCELVATTDRGHEYRVLEPSVDVLTALRSATEVLSPVVAESDDQIVHWDIRVHPEDPRPVSYRGVEVHHE